MKVFGVVARGDDDTCCPGTDRLCCDRGQHYPLRQGRAHLSCESSCRGSEAPGGGDPRILAVIPASYWAVVKILGPLLGPVNKRCRVLLGTQKRTITLTTTHMRMNLSKHPT